MRRAWVLRAALGAWIVAGVAALLAVATLPPGPEIAQRLYGDARSMRSSAPEGALAFARALATLGFLVSANRRADSPDADALFLLAPRVDLSNEEEEVLIAWVRRGGRLAYAPAIDASTDGLAQKVRSQGARLTSAAGTDLWQVGAGRVALLHDRGDALTNRSLRTRGLAGELGWLSPLLAGVHRVAFDEARIGLAPSESIVDLAVRSRYGPAVGAAGLALLVGLVAAYVRREPAVSAPRHTDRDFAEHIDTLALALAERTRTRLASELLIAGSVRRMGDRARRPRVAARLEALALAPVDVGGLVERARGLWQLEREVTAGGGPPAASRAPESETTPSC